MLKITIDNGVARVFTPYNATFVSKIKTIGGRKWDAAAGCWTVPESEIGVVRKHMMDVYGETDQVDDVDRVTLMVKFNKMEYEVCKSIVMFGKTIVRATGRDSGARTGDDVALIEGGIGSGGSVKNWHSIAYAGAVLKVRNVPRTAIGMTGGYDVTVEEVKDVTPDRTALIEEREKLLARLAEIDKLLGE